MDAKSSEREKQICERLRQFRESLQIPRTRFALSLGVTEAALAGYELGRARIRYETFAAVQKRFLINPVWLATGEENLIHHNWTDEKFRAQVKPRELFSHAYERLIAKHLQCERINKDGTLANAKLAKDWFASLPRFRQALEAAGVDLEELAKRLEQEGFSLGTAKDLKAIEAGKKYPGARAVALLIHELRVTETWLWSGKGEMFLRPGQKPGELFHDNTHGRARLRSLVGNVREYMETLSAGLGALEAGLIEYEQDLITAARTSSSTTAMEKASSGAAPMRASEKEQVKAARLDKNPQKGL
jgi:transcriptional regulator with XRE-family HTH domain